MFNILNFIFRNYVGEFKNNFVKNLKKILYFNNFFP